MVVLKEIQNRLIESIRLSGMTQTKIAKELHITQSTVAHYLKGDILPALDTLANLCLLLDVSPEYILCFNKKEL